MTQPLDQMPLNTPIKAVFSNGSHTLSVYGKRIKKTRHVEGEAPQIVDVFKAYGLLPEYPYTMKGYQA